MKHLISTVVFLNDKIPADMKGCWRYRSQMSAVASHDALTINILKTWAQQTTIIKTTSLNEETINQGIMPRCSSKNTFYGYISQTN